LGSLVGLCYIKTDFPGHSLFVCCMFVLLSPFSPFFGQNSKGPDPLLFLRGVLLIPEQALPSPSRPIPLSPYIGALFFVPANAFPFDLVCAFPPRAHYAEMSVGSGDLVTSLFSFHFPVLPFENRCLCLYDTGGSVSLPLFSFLWIFALSPKFILSFFLVPWAVPPADPSFFLASLSFLSILMLITEAHGPPTGFSLQVSSSSALSGKCGKIPSRRDGPVSLYVISLFGCLRVFFFFFFSPLCL